MGSFGKTALVHPDAHRDFASLNSRIHTGFYYPPPSRDALAEQAKDTDLKISKSIYLRGHGPPCSYYL